MRYDTRGRPPAPPVRDSAAIAIRMFRALHMCLHIEIETREGLMLRKTNRPGDKTPPGVSRFSTLFNVAAIGGKSPRTIDCLMTLSKSDRAVKLSGFCHLGFQACPTPPRPVRA